MDTRPSSIPRTSLETISFKPTLHVFICTNDRAQTGDPRPSCGPQITPEMVKEIKLWIRTQGLTADIYCTKASCLGFCNPDGGVMCIWPQGIFLKGITSVDEIKQVISDEARRVGL
ncbi:(2Fe-2S) ferredoxin domain-containing protein [Candidatus Woesearchaeota archaeon]|nr:(2Fe-2S) ferredoxin domain-containing protein [Candidatus Woesearchaeota archaeon]